MSKTRQRRTITQNTGAMVELEGEQGKVVGHYNDDIVFVDFGRGPERCWTDSLTVVETKL